MNFDVWVYYDYKLVVFDVVFELYVCLCVGYDMVIVEGVGSLVEINLCDGDIVNMGFVEWVDCLVVFVVDIDCGGVFVYLVGMFVCLLDSECVCVCGFVINCFCGDFKLFELGFDWLCV